MKCANQHAANENTSVYSHTDTTTSTGAKISAAALAAHSSEGNALR